MSINLINLGMKIKQLRNDAGLTQGQVADFLSIDQSLVSKIKKGERSINTEVLDRIAVLFCYPISSLLSEEPNKSTYSIAFNTVLANADLSALSAINKIALNQLKMDHIGGIKNSA